MGIGIGDWAQSPIPKPPCNNFYYIYINKKILFNKTK